MSFLLRDRGPSPLRRFIPKLVLLASSLVFTLLVTEASLRIAFYHSKDFAMEMWKYAVQLKQPVSNPDLSFVHVRLSVGHEAGETMVGVKSEAPTFGL